ncbi:MULTISPECIES: DUF5696 domain-containing protein [unclassified Paenibacillus]|uniref:DUF5696 domain-containing protein n=1 Tax=unclassified Paenibacillus TaxID=185978 RepID=UPI000CF85BCC|nr:MULTISPECIES: DUF5696 domain-containing protein [unclassified Paenibacillus]MBJ9990100.1 hypothetical protein [Paenibacillus sp. S28]PQP86112.1 hypothetical protein CPT76_30850 [Paenibacillus sp. AR247]
MLLLLVFKPWEQTTAERFSQTGIAANLPTPDALYEGDPWKPAAGADGYALALENEHYALYVRPDNTQIAVLDKASGYRWTSNPTKEELAGETVKGQLLANLQSPFLLTHVRTQGADQTVRETLSNQTAGMQIAMIRKPEGLQIEYSFPAKQLGFVMQYELTDNGLKVKVPAAGIREEGASALFSLDVLPYFGAAPAKENGYVFVPDGPGGLIRFDQEHASLTRGYSHQVYGKEITNEENWTRTGERREDIAYPVFGLKKGDHAFLAVMTKGEDSANVSAMAPGLKSSFYQVFSSQIYREEYLYRMSRLAAPSKAVQKERLNRDREVEYRFLNGADADYVGMAGAYRSYLQETGRLTEALKPVDHVPLYLKIMGGNYEKAFGRIRYVAATTFEQAGDIVSTLQSKGVASLRTIFYGWQNEGDYNMEKRFPIDPALGGEAAAKTFISGMKERGVPVSFSEDFLWVDGHSSFSGKTDAIRGIDGTAYVDDGWYIAKPAYTAVTAADTVNRLKKLGVNGIHFSGIGEMLLNDYEPSGIQTREYAKTVYDGLLKYTREALGSASVNQGDAYALGQTDYIDGLPSESSYDFMIDETVPFYPIVLHGFIPYTFGDGNLRDDEDTEFLRAIEYGALPSFFVTHDDSRKLKDTPSNFLYSSRFDKWERRIEEEYAKFDSLSQLYSMKIIGHEKLSGQKYATTYEDGTRVIVDYGVKDFTVEKGAGK